MPATQQEHEWHKSPSISTLPYPSEAYEFLQDGLAHTAERIYENSQMETPDRHVRGQELCLGLRDLAIERWGLMAPAVLRHWKIYRTDDFGRIVFAMIDAKLMKKTDEDTLDDFRGVYQFDEAFSREALLHGIGAV